MKIFAGGSRASGIIGAGPQTCATEVESLLPRSLALCAAAVIAYNTMAANVSRDAPFQLVSFRFTMFFSPMRSPKSLLLPTQ